MKKPWDKNNEESDLAYMYFNSYLSLGATRSIPKVCQMYTKKESYVGQLKRWSVDHNWVNRCSEYDTYIAEKVLESQEATFNKARALLLDNLMKVVDELLDIALGGESMEMKPGEALIISSKLKAIQMIFKAIGFEVIPIKEPEQQNNMSVQDYVRNLYKTVEDVKSREN